MPLSTSKSMKSRAYDLAAQSTTKVTFDFYFPSPGTFQHFPSNISIDGEVQARSEANTFTVKQTATLISQDKLIQTSK